MKTPNKNILKNAALFALTIALFEHSDVFAQSRPDPFEGADSALSDGLEFFRSGVFKSLGAVAMTAALIGSFILSLFPKRTALLVCAGVLLVMLVPEFIAFLTAI